MSTPAFQFLRIHAHGADAAGGLLAEADRVPSHCSHIERPTPTRWWCGTKDEVQHAVERFMREPQLVRPKSGGERYRKPRSDLRCFMDCVASYPIEVQYLQQASNLEKSTLRDWLIRTHEFIQHEFGPNYISSCIHLDESHPHLHF